MMKQAPPVVLLTGASGFVGSYVLQQLSKLNVSVIATYREIKPAIDSLDNVCWIKMDMADRMDKQLAKIHLAWGGLPNYKSDFHTTQELTRQKTFLDRAIDLGIPNIFVAGTCFEYGMVDGILSENMTPQPHTEYGAAKNLLRLHLQKRQIEKSFNLTWGRLFYLFGKGQGERSLYTQLQAAIENNAKHFDMSGGEQERDFLAVERTAEIIAKLALCQSDFGLVNICSGQPTSVKNIVKEWLFEANTSIDLNLGVYPYPDYEAMQFWGDDTKLRAILSKV